MFCSEIIVISKILTLTLYDLRIREVLLQTRIHYDFCSKKFYCYQHQDFYNNFRTLLAEFVVSSM